jgi:hypothetical protein
LQQAEASADDAELPLVPVRMCAGALANVDALEDATAAFHWCWELRTLAGLPKAAKQHADAARKHRKQVQPAALLLQPGATAPAAAKVLLFQAARLPTGAPCSNQCRAEGV